MEGEHMAIVETADVKVADEVWIAAALLQQENPDQTDFSVEDIVERARREKLTSEFRPGVYVHALQHCVANRSPNPGRYRMLFETAPGRRRLFRPGDPYHPQREGRKIVPPAQDIPEQYRPLLAWYHEWTTGSRSDGGGQDPLLSLRGSGRKLWADEHADDYVRRLREGWE
jgi:hypothetical protein